MNKVQEVRLPPAGHLRWWEYNNGDIEEVAVWADEARYYGENIRTGQNYCLRAFQFLRTLMEQRAQKTNRPVRMWVTLKHPAARKAVTKVFGDPQGWWSFIQVHPDGSVKYI